MTDQNNNCIKNDSGKNAYSPPASTRKSHSNSPFVIYKSMLAFFDITSVVAAFYLSFTLRNLFFNYRGGIYVARSIHLLLLFLLIIFVLAIFRQQKLYQQLAFSRSPAHLQTMVGAWVRFFGFFIVIAFFFRIQLFSEHRITTAFFFVLGGLFLYLGRFVAVPHILSVYFKLRQQTYDILLVGATVDTILNVMEINKNKPWPTSLVVISGTQEPLTLSASGCRVIGTIDDLRHIVATRNISEVFVCTKENDFPTMTKILTIMRPLTIPTRVAIRHFEIIKEKIPILPELENGFISFNTSAFIYFDRAVKVCLDYTGALLGLIVTSPILLLITILIRKESKGPALFRQKRVGKDDIVFDVLKFRSMKENTESHHKEVIGALMNKDHEAVNEASGRRGFFKSVQNDCVTRVGRILRKSSLDELPQLFNILRGEMSLVGPRPEPTYQVELYAPWQHARHVVKPGLTGLWQAYGRSAVTHEDVVLMDIFYINNWSIALDFQILIRTIFVVLTGHGAT